MARIKGFNKSQAVRDYLGENPQANVREVVEAMAAKQIEVSDNLVYGLKGAMKEKQQRKKRVAKAALATVATASSNGVEKKTDAITMIREVKALAEKAGGYEKLKELVDALAE